MTSPVLASRVMKARRESQCPACRAWIHPGDLIAKTNLGWLHCCCAIARQHDKEND